MNKNLIQIFETFKTSVYYNQSTSHVDLDWLKSKLKPDDIQELEGQIYCLLLGNEEELFINTLKYIWQIGIELSSIDA